MITSTTTGSQLSPCLQKSGTIFFNHTFSHFRYLNSHSPQFTEKQRSTLKHEIALFVTSFGSAVSNLRKSNENYNNYLKNGATKSHHTEIIDYLLEVGNLEYFQYYELYE